MAAEWQDVELFPDSGAARSIAAEIEVLVLHNPALGQNFLLVLEQAFLRHRGYLWPDAHLNGYPDAWADGYPDARLDGRLDAFLAVQPQACARERCYLHRAWHQAWQVRTVFWSPSLMLMRQVRQVPPTPQTFFPVLKLWQPLIQDGISA